VEGVAREKAMLPATLDAGKTPSSPDCLQYSDFGRLRARCLVLARAGEDISLPAPNYEVVRYNVTADAATGLNRMTLEAPGFAALRVELPRLSAGMLSNAALALTAAQMLGVSPQWMQIRLAQWRPGAFRGEVVRIGTVDFYVDCYNANPASMRDSVAAFQNLFPKQRRLFLLGCMNELGPRSDELHSELGRSLRLAASDKVCVIGRECEQVRQGLLASGLGEGQVCAGHSLELARDCLESFSKDGGAVLLKGSRGYRLELLLPDTEQRKTALLGLAH
jgi:UDP-N-acetylmuramyl pentapeptide synthase